MGTGRIQQVRINHIKPYFEGKHRANMYPENIKTSASTLFPVAFGRISKMPPPGLITDWWETQLTPATPSEALPPITPVTTKTAGMQGPDAAMAPPGTAPEITSTSDTDTSGTTPASTLGDGLMQKQRPKRRRKMQTPSPRVDDDELVVRRSVRKRRPPDRYGH